MDKTEYLYPPKEIVLKNYGFSKWVLDSVIESEETVKYIYMTPYKQKECSFELPKKYLEFIQLPILEIVSRAMMYALDAEGDQL